MNIFERAKQSLKGSHKGSWLDLTLLPFILLAVGIILLASLTIMNAVYDGFNDPDINMSLDSSNAARDNALAPIENARNVLKYFDILFVVVLVSLNIFIIVSAYAIRTHPIMFIIALIFQMINVLMADISSNVYRSFASNAQFLVAATEFETVTIIILELPKVMIIIGLALAVFMLAKPPNDGSV